MYAGGTYLFVNVLLNLHSNCNFMHDLCQSLVVHRSLFAHMCQDNTLTKVKFLRGNNISSYAAHVDK